jgi:hypothetical protein
MVYVNANVVIYCVENHPLYGPLLLPLWQAAQAKTIEVVSSELALMEGNLREAVCRDRTGAGTIKQNGGATMITFQITAEIKDDRRVVLTLPPEFPTGQTKLVVTVDPSAPENQQPRMDLADWAEVQAERNGSEQSRYPLRGSVVRYEQPTEPVAEGDWEALR